MAARAGCSEPRRGFQLADFSLRSVPSGALAALRRAPAACVRRLCLLAARCLGGARANGAAECGTVLLAPLSAQLHALGSAAQGIEGEPRDCRTRVHTRNRARIADRTLRRAQPDAALGD